LYCAHLITRPTRNAALLRSLLPPHQSPLVFSFTPPAPPELYTLSLHDALPIFSHGVRMNPSRLVMTSATPATMTAIRMLPNCIRSEEHTSELQSPYDLVCRLLLEKKKKHPHQSPTPET